MKKLCLFMLVAFVIPSCSEKEQSLEPIVNSAKLTSKDVSIENGVLRFASPEHFRNVAKELSNMKGMENWYSNPEFVSLLKTQKSISKQEHEKIADTGKFGELSDVLTFKEVDGDKLLTEIVEIPELSAVLNSKSYVIVGDSAYHFSLDHFTSIYIGKDLDKLSSFVKNPNLPEVRTNKIKKVSLDNARIQLGTFRNTEGNRRIEAEHSEVQYGPGLATYRKIRIDYYKKNWIGWSHTEAAYLSFTVTATSSMWGGYLPPQKWEGSNVERIGADIQDFHLGPPPVYNINVRMKCTVFREYDQDI